MQAPKQKDQAIEVPAEPQDHSICEELPALTLMRAGLLSPHCQHWIQQQNTWQWKEHLQWI